MTGAIALEPLDLVVASALVLAAGGISLALRLDLERRLALASVRTVVQLLLIGHILRWVFAVESPWLLFGILGIMIFAASRAAVGRSSRRFAGAVTQAFATLIVVGLATTFAVTAVIVGVEPWYSPQYVIPLCGMILGNSLTGISLCLDHLLESLTERRALVELELSLGATRWEAARESLQQAVRRGMIPIINSMTVVGLVSLPGMMTGQILAGADPVDAVAYQIVVMFMLAFSSSTGCIGVALLVYRRFFNARHQLDVRAIEKR